MKLAASLVCVTSILIAGCVGSPPTFTTNVSEARTRLEGTIGSVSASVDPTAQKTGDVQMIFGVDDISASWRQALAGALDQSRIFDKSARVVEVRVTIYKLKPPTRGSTIETPVTARYQVFDVNSQLAIYETTVENIGYVGPGENFLGVVRIRDSIDRAVQNNIKEFIDQLAKVRALPRQ